MLTPEQIDGVILAGSYRNAAGGIYTTCTEDFARDIETLATAEARALVGQMLEALAKADEGTTDGGLGPGFQNGHGEECGTAIKAARDRLAAWLGEAQKGDGHDPQ